MHLYNHYFKKPLVVLGLLGIATACEPDIERDAPSYEEARGDADFTTYVALGNSITAGYADGALNRQNQLWSFPAILAEQIQYIKPDLNFTQPLLPEGRANGTLYIQSFVNGRPVLLPETSGLSQQQIYAQVTGTFQNLGVPGAKVGDLIMPGYGSAQGNPYFARFASAPTATVVEMAAAQSPTFFTLWIGNNDVLGYATAGGEGTITDPATFRTSYETIINQLKASNANIEGALANILSISEIPYFNTVPWNAFALESQGQVDQLAAGFTAQIDPAIRSQVLLGVITEGARRQIIAEVAPAVVYKQAFDAAVAQGATPEQADAAAQQYVQSTEGQAVIAALVTSLTEDREPAAAHAIVEQNLASEAVQNQIQQNFEGASQADAAGQLAAAIGEEGAATVNAIQAQQITQLKAAGFYPTFTVGANGFVVQDETSPTTIRQLTEGEKMTLTFLTASAEEFNPEAGQVIVPDKYALDVNELQQVNDAIEAYNTIIAEIASENTFALVDINAFFDQVAGSGITEGGTRFTAAFVTGNAFSLDGVHPTPKGYALVAQKFIEAINAYYGSEIPSPSLSKYPAVAFPNN